MKIKFKNVMVTSSIIMNLMMMAALVYITKTTSLLPEGMPAPLIVLLSKSDGAATIPVYGQVLSTSPLN